MAGDESSSGCQSGWTMYFDQSYLAPHPLSPGYNKEIYQFESPREEDSESESEDEEEDLSMVSDASSGPPHFDTEEQHSECGTFLLLSESKRKRKVDRLSDTKREHFCSSLDDTASSPMLNHSNSSGTASTTDLETTVENALEFSCAFSGTSVKEESALQKNTCYLQSVANLKLPTTTMYQNKKIKRRNDDEFPSWNSQEQQMQEFL